MKVLDVAAGNGNFAVAAARIGAGVTASDVSAHMVGLGRGRSRAEGLDVTWLEADAESLPFAAAFDVVASVFGAMFAPRPELVAEEMFRTARPGGVVAMANYGSAGYLGRLSDLIGTFSNAPPSALPSPYLWGEPDEVRRRFRGLASKLAVEPGILTFRFASLEAWREEFANTNPPLMALKQILPAAAFEGLIAQAVALVDELNPGARRHRGPGLELPGGDRPQVTLLPAFADHGHAERADSQQARVDLCSVDQVGAGLSDRHVHVEVAMVEQEQDRAAREMAPHDLHS